MEMLFTQNPIKSNRFREQKYNISPPGKGIRLPLWVGVPTTITIKFIRASPLLF